MRTERLISEIEVGGGRSGDEVEVEALVEESKVVVVDWCGEMERAVEDGSPE